VLHIPAPYHVAPQKVIPLIRETVASIPNVASERTPIARIGDFADSSVIYEILYWTKDYMWVPDIDAQIRQHVWYIYRRSEIDIPFPMRHVLLERQAKPVSQQEDEYGYERVIESVEIFAPLSTEEKEAVARSAIKSVFAPGELILRRGAPGDSMFVIYRGNVEIRLPNRDGNAQQVAELKPGNFFGEMALLTGEPRNADVIAVGEVETLEITKAILQQLLDNNSALAEGLSQMIAERQSRLDEYARDPAVMPFHLWLRPGPEIIEKHGGLHGFMGWKGPILTDSGGFQVFSLETKVSEDGVRFASPINGDRLLLTPEESMGIQKKLNSDVVMVFDECTPYPATEKQARDSMQLSLRWAIGSNSSVLTSSPTGAVRCLARSGHSGRHFGRGRFSARGHGRPERRCAPLENPRRRWKRGSSAERPACLPPRERSLRASQVPDPGRS
jgi:hypothetical protein